MVQGVPHLAITEGDFPNVFHMADQASRTGQNSALRRNGIALFLVVAGAIAGLLDWRVRRDGINVGGLVSFLCFGGALYLTATIAKDKPEEAWYKGRALAESVKSSSWMYAVGGTPFALSVANVDAKFAAHVRSMLSELGELDPPGASGEVQISKGMRALRRAPLADRRDVYLRDRIGDQAKWYADRNALNSRRAHQWARVLSAVTLIGVILAGLRALTIIDWDALGVVAAVSASGSAWVQLRQHRTLATAYALAAADLGLVASDVPSGDDESAWCRFVSDAEDAISREHTMWLARRRGRLGRDAQVEGRGTE